LSSILTAQERLGDPSRYQARLLHVEPDGSFSVVALVWQPGQATTSHDHVTWGAFAVLRGTEYEEAHRITNHADATLIQLHVYGTDIGRLDRHPITQYPRSVASAAIRW